MMLGRAFAIGFLLAASLTTVACADAYGGNDGDPRGMLGPRLKRSKRDAGATADASADASGGADGKDDAQLEVLELSGRTPEEEADAGIAESE